jgi:hypothetical protein
VQDSLCLAGVTQYLPIAESVDAALAGLAPTAASAEDSDRDAPQGEPAV